MLEHDIAAEFSQDVDDLLQGKAYCKKDNMGQEYQKIMELSQLCIKTDFSEESKIRDGLRVELMESLQEKKYRNNFKEVIMNNLFNRYRSAAGLGFVALVALLAITIAFPGTVKGLTDNILKVLKLGSHSAVIQIDSTASQNKIPASALTLEEQEILEKEGYIEKELSDGTVRIRNYGVAAICEFESEKSNDSERLIYTDIDEAVKAVDFKVFLPEYLPVGYSFKNAESYQDSREYLNLIYSDGEKEIILMQRAMNSNTAFTLGTDGSISSVEINGVMGAWLEPHSILWEKEEISYALFCQGLTKDEAIKIANSIE